MQSSFASIGYTDAPGYRIVGTAGREHTE